MKEEFKLFVKNKPELIDYVTSGKMTWQKFYEIWSLYGSDNKVWDKYKSINENKIDNNFNISSIMDTIKKVDVNSLKKGINGFQKMIELLQGFLVKDSASTSNYEPRKLFQKFED